MFYAMNLVNITELYGYEYLFKQVINSN